MAYQCLHVATPVTARLASTRAAIEAEAAASTGVLSADVYARYCRLRGYNAIYVFGTDEYGTATETKALEENCTPKDIYDKYHAIHREVYKWFNINFDEFGRTATPQQTEIVKLIMDLWLMVNNWFGTMQLYCDKCNKFLPDRLMEGNCPTPGCKNDSARGDQCDDCSKLLNLMELINPRCKYIKKMSMEGGWSQNAIHVTNDWLKEGLRQRCITRDIKWGVPVPLEKFKEKKSGRSGGKILKMWSLWARIMFPFTLSYHVVLIDFLYLLLKNYSVRSFGEFSKSKGVGVFGNDAKDTGIPIEVSDTLFTWADLQAKLHTELLNNLGNFINRVLSFIAKPGKFLYLTNLYTVCWETLLEIFTIHATMAYLGAGKGSGYNSIIPDAPGAKSHLLTKVLADKIGNYVDQYVEAMEKVKLKQGLKIAMSISGEGNAYLQAQVMEVKA
ncbi:probable methionine--tRNA ligase [Tanacetum coccineum]